MTNNQKFVAGLIIGTAAGVATALFLNTDKGKEVVTRIKDITDDAYNNLKETANTFSSNVESFVEKGKEYMHEFNQKQHDGTIV